MVKVDEEIQVQRTDIDLANDLKEDKLESEHRRKANDMEEDKSHPDDQSKLSQSFLENIDKEQLFILPPIFKENPKDVRERELRKKYLSNGFRMG